MQPQPKIKQFKCRASGSSDIMGIKGLGQTGKTFVENWYKEQLYSRRKEIKTKQMEKGTVQESGAIELIADHYGYGLITKNEKEFENDFITGTPDLILSDKIIDIKCSWDAFTFPLFNSKDDTYYEQMQCYMALTGLQKAEVIYCLMDALDKQIDDEAWKKAKALGLEEVPIELFDQVKKDMTYSNLPNHLRIKAFTIERDDLTIAKIYERVKECREYLKTIIIADGSCSDLGPAKSTVNIVGGLELDWNA